FSPRVEALACVLRRHWRVSRVETRASSGESGGDARLGSRLGHADAITAADVLGLFGAARLALYRFRPRLRGASSSARTRRSRDASVASVLHAPALRSYGRLPALVVDALGPGRRPRARPQGLWSAAAQAHHR